MSHRLSSQKPFVGNMGEWIASFNNSTLRLVMDKMHGEHGPFVHLATMGTLMFSTSNADAAMDIINLVCQCIASRPLCSTISNHLIQSRRGRGTISAFALPSNRWRMVPSSWLATSGCFTAGAK